MKKIFILRFGRESALMGLAFLFMLASASDMYAQKKRPTIVLNGDDTIVVEEGDTFSDPGYVVYDTNNNVISSAQCSISSQPSGFNGRMGVMSYTLTYNYSSGADTALPVKRRLKHMSDTTKPVIQLLGDDTVLLEQCQTFTDPGATAQDNLDGNITSKIKKTSVPKFDNMIPGAYHISYDVQDAAGNNAGTKKKVIIVTPDTTAPELELVGDLYDTILLGSTWNDPGASKAQDCVDGNLLTEVHVTGYVDANTSGTYHLVYTITDASSNTATAHRYVTVGDTQLNISGKVIAGTSPGSQRAARVLLIQFDPDDSTLTALDTFSFAKGNSPNYHFDDLAPGDYLVKAALDSTDSLYTNYIPTYYGGETMWDDATPITLSLFSAANKDINMVAGTNPGGYGFIAGHVRQGANKKEGDPIEGQLILLTTLNDETVAYTYSNETGYYEFRDIAFGDYKIVGESEGKKALGDTITLDVHEYTSPNVDLIVKSTEILTVIYKVECRAHFHYEMKGRKTILKADISPNKNLKYTWTLYGDTATGTVVTHQYPNSGMYYTCLTVTDTVHNCSDKYCESVFVRFPEIKISGKVSTTGAKNTTATVWLMQYDENKETYTMSKKQQVYIDDSSYAYYEFYYNLDGNYLVRATMNEDVPYFREFMPTYHGPAMRWKNAAVTTLVDKDVDGIDIMMTPVSKPNGKGIVKGRVLKEALGVPEEQAPVMLFDENGNPVSYDLTNGGGFFEITGIPNGKYEVYVELAGMSSYSYWIEITDEHYEFNGMDFTVRNDNTISSLEEIPASVEGITLFPNPADQMLNLRLNLVKPQKITVTITDMSGKTVMMRAENLAAGERNLQFDLSELANGVYTVNVADASGKTSRGTFVKR